MLDKTIPSLFMPSIFVSLKKLKKDFLIFTSLMRITEVRTKNYVQLLKQKNNYKQCSLSQINYIYF